MNYDCAIVGGGFAGVQAAIQLGRYRHSVVVLDREGGRSSLCRRYHNLLGWPDGVSGPELLRLGRRQAEELGVRFVRADIGRAERRGDSFTLHADDGTVYRARRLLLATGVKDRLPDLPGLLPCLGLTIFICPDCDGYEVRGRRTLVIGSGDAGANMALTLAYWTNDLVYVNHEGKAVSPDRMEQIRHLGIEYREEAVIRLETDGGELLGIELQSGDRMPFNRAFLALGGNEVKSELAVQLGVAVADNRHIKVDPRTKLTNVEHVWAAGDVTVHSEQAIIAMGDGAQAAIWMHKSLLS
ncbi:pyridine nucleotide-disulfide oxidoreductase [Paenibacillus sp. 32O-W]|uniref:NAD(P)/FAD-dependent oxidoreductase n=1 Tax=Paenibacillus sp. 32O-W TaxID=1695218 RepID=UPI0007230CAA|nr:NAD(P)/FAD-dependent oxidoreductase [Paenibacillus sp. 32O-W]ALS28312.1 pyridine nucleotide-disulfide oxidoreductase [Paenibacillus sp. 32O-W]